MSWPTNKKPLPPPKRRQKSGPLTADLCPLGPLVREREDFWALKTSLSSSSGEVLGIIGRNGAGKSTLLKILSRITEPTEGRVRIEGRVARSWRSAPAFIRS